MGCSEGTINNNCLTRQSFCALGKQFVSQNPIQKQIENTPEFAEANMWKQIKNILNNIKNYGQRGTRNPPNSSIEDIPFPDKEEFTYLNLYNSIIRSLRTGTNNINSSNGELLNINSFLENFQINKLQTYINNYKLNEDRCNSCNTQCNANCQASKQGSGGGGGCGTSDCIGMSDCGIGENASCTSCYVSDWSYTERFDGCPQGQN